MTTAASNPVLVGLGDAPDDAPELDWGAREAQSRGCALEVLRVVDTTPLAVPWETATGRLIESDLRRAAQTRLQWAAGYLETAWPDVRVETRLPEGEASQVLLDRSASAVLTVLGSRQRGSIRSALLGSVGTSVTARAQAPVVVVRGPGGDRGTGSTVVAGADGSPAMHDVMAFALDHASRHRLPLRVVFCYSLDLLATSPWRTSAPSSDRAGRWLAEVTAGWQEKYPDVEMHRTLVLEKPVPALVEQSRGQDLLVVGSHGHRSRIASLLGSVSQGVLHHSQCPVAVVPLREHA